MNSRTTGMRIAWGNGRKHFIGFCVIALISLDGACVRAQEGGERAHNSVASAILALQNFRDDPKVQALVANDRALGATLNNVSRELKAAERQINGELKLSSEGVARDMTFHLFALTRDLKKIAELDAVLVDIEALLAISTEYQGKHDEWMRLRRESDDRASLFAREYLEKVRRFQTYCPNLCEVAFKEIERSNGSTTEGQKIVSLISQHYKQERRLTQSQVIGDVRRDFDLKSPD